MPPKSLFRDGNVPRSSLLFVNPVRFADPFACSVPTKVSEKTKDSCPSGNSVEYVPSPPIHPGPVSFEIALSRFGADVAVGWTTG